MVLWRIAVALVLNNSIMNIRLTHAKIFTDPGVKVASAFVSVDRILR